MADRFRSSSARRFAEPPGGAARRQPEAVKALILSPLLNFSPASPGGPTIVQHVKLRSSRNHQSSGTATLSLAPDGRLLTVTVEDQDGHHSIDVRLRRVGGLAVGAAANLRALELRRVRGPGAGAFKAQVALADGAACASLSLSEHLPLSPSAVEELRAEAILGLPARPASAAAAPQGTTPDEQRDSLSYLDRRLTEELAAAVTARLPVATSRHVELATLYARSIQALRETPASAGPDRSVAPTPRDGVAVSERR